MQLDSQGMNELMMEVHVLGELLSFDIPILSQLFFSNVRWTQSQSNLSAGVSHPIRFLCIMYLLNTVSFFRPSCINHSPTLTNTCLRRGRKREITHQHPTPECILHMAVKLHLLMVCATSITLAHKCQRHSKCELCNG